MQKLVFIVDDNDSNLTMAASALEDQYRVLTMPSAEKMFFVLGKGKLPSLILLDIEMPGVNGVDALRKLKASPEWAEIPVLFLTGHSGEDILAGALALGAEGVIGKPIISSVLLERVSQFIE